MIFRTLLFFVLMYLLVKVISRLFLNSSQKNGQSRNSFRFQNFKNFSQPQNRQQNYQKSSGKGSKFDSIEEAEFEDVTDDKNSTAKTAD
ncbi:MAG TPA: hypothetical protein VFG39_09555 [Balneolaceae bacterium]|nr:hypothetical protein [Balneolaceae bacterium]